MTKLTNEEELYYKHIDGYWKDAYEAGDFYNKKPFKKSYKREWAFTCVNCEEKITVPTNPVGHYYTWNICQGNPFKSTKKGYPMLCSKECADEGFRKLTLSEIKSGRLMT
jgi:hypothetical protein